MRVLNVLIVPDKFKGTLRAEEAARAIAAGWQDSRPRDRLELLPMSDGGDGFGGIIGGLCHAVPQTTRALNAAHEPIDAQWWWADSTRTAIVESANVIGLAMLPPGRFHPFELDTLGLGQLLFHIARKHPGAELIVGIGGSATNDAGFGLARGLGYRFFDATGLCLDRWVALDGLLHVSRPESPLNFSKVTIATDVQNPLLGPDGASRIYGPQKGLRPENFPAADKAFARLTQVVRTDLGLDRAAEPGTGAAGGLGYGLRVFLEGEFQPGFNIFSHLAQLESKIAAADLVITAEGAIDAQTEMGKGTGAIANLARQHKKPVIGLAGSLPQKENRAFDLALAIVPDFASVEEAKRDAAHWLQKLASHAATKIPALNPATLAMIALAALLLTACKNPAASSRRPDPSTPEARAVAFLSRDVPAWHRDHGCFSCHNNGDGARALFAAWAAGYSVPADTLADTLDWLELPESWSSNKGDPNASDQRLADIQFASTLRTALDTGLVRNRPALNRAALRLLPHQGGDGSWNVEPHNPVGSPVTYGTPLATYFAWRILSASTSPAIQPALEKAERWFREHASSRETPAAAAQLLYALDTKDSRLVEKMVSHLTNSQLPGGGWGPYAQSPPEIFDTSLALWALSRANASPAALASGRAFLAAHQNPDGSWPATTRPRGGESYAQQISTTAWAALALLALPPPGSNPALGPSY